MAAEAASLWEEFGRPEVIAFVGGGGKTTLACRTAREAAAAGRTVLTTTTRMLVPRVPEDVEEVLVAGSLEAAQKGLSEAFGRNCRLVAVISGVEDSPHGRRAVGVPPEWVAGLRGPELADTVVVEADGSRKLPFKAPRRPKEPVVPVGTSVVVAVAGVDCLGRTLNEDEVCRADVVAELCGLELGAQVTADVVGRVLGQSALWCPDAEAASPGPLFFAVVNKADDAQSIAAAESIAAATLRHGSGLDGVLLTGERDGLRGSVVRRMSLA
eukprot:TRINITY_DN71993_c0_g1_i1.p3 TRINITY_DN71993_c0_g1~~TRINITY_DN71993_c0_g1_i1.p3  ORF type:complete len:270 (+),score=58.64 TRINITY_DN71993_c0_g1_i1:178-987(+)